MPSNQSPILIVEDDDDDIFLIRSIVESLNIDRPVEYFTHGEELLKYMTAATESPFLILCDMNLPGETGFEVRELIAEDENLRYKSVPFIFWSTAASDKQVQKAYDLPAQGLFLKPASFDELCTTFQMILGYWSKSKHPKSVS